MHGLLRGTKYALDYAYDYEVIVFNIGPNYVLLQLASTLSFI